MSKIIKSEFYDTNPKRKKSSKPLSLLFKFNSTIKSQKMAIIIRIFFPMIFLWISYSLVHAQIQSQPTQNKTTGKTPTGAMPHGLFLGHRWGFPRVGAVRSCAGIVEWFIYRKNHRKIIGTNIGIIMAIFGSFMGKMCLNSGFKSFLELICSRLVQ